MSRSSLRRAGAAGALALVVAAVGTIVLTADGGGRDCDSIDYLQFRSTQPRGPSSPRIALGDAIVRCDALQGRSRAEVRTLLGRSPPGGTRDEWLYELGQRAPADLDSSQLLVTFRGERVVEARIVET